MPKALKRSAALLVIAVAAVLLRVLSGVGFANYDTLYALAWGGQLSRGVAPAYGVPIAPTPHPLLELMGLVLAPLGPAGAEHVTVGLAFLALAACGWVLFRLGSEWFGVAAGALAALIFLTRVPVLSYGVRAYVDLPYLLFVLLALLLESRSRRRSGSPAGSPVLALLAIAGLLRPEAWAFSGLYWLYLMALTPRRLRAEGWASLRVKDGRWRGRPAGEALRLTLLAVAAPLVWMLSDLVITGDPLWSLTNTRHTAETLGRVSGITNVPEYIPRRIGEILRPPVLVGAALGGILSLLWLRGRALPGAVAGALAVLVFALFATAGLPINTRYAFLSSAILCIFCGTGVFGWLQLRHGDRHRRPWMVAGLLVLIALIAYLPSQLHLARRTMSELSHQHSIEGELLALVHNGAINLRCGRVGVPNHAPVPLLALYLKTSPRNIVSLQSGHLDAGVYVDPANAEVERDYVLDRHDPVEAVSVPPGFRESAANRSWLIFTSCA